MKNLSKTLIVVAIPLAALAVFAAASIAQSTDQAAGNIHCMSLPSVRTSALFDLQTPNALPDGYEYKCGIADKYAVTLLFSNRTIDRSTYSIEQDAQDDVARGAIMMRITDERSLAGNDFSFTNSTKAVIYEYEYVLKENSSLKPQLFELRSGKIGWGHGYAAGAGEQTAVFPDGKSITNRYDVPARLRTFDDGKIIHFEGNVPVETLVQVAKSLQ